MQLGELTLHLNGVSNLFLYSSDIFNRKLN